MPRVAPITSKADVPAEHHAVVDKVVGVFGGVRGPFSMLLHSPKLAERVLRLVTFFRDESIVEPKLRSVAILAAVREREAAYVWAAQVGRRPPQRRERGRDRPPASEGRSGKASRRGKGDRDLRPPADAHEPQRPGGLRLAQERHGTPWLVELTAAANYFALLSGVVNAFEVAAPADGDKLPAS